ncbi:MAG TPA: ribonuclease PH [bacterium]|nr:ribonuclease PH [bacterium]
MRADDRKDGELRPVKIIPGFVEMPTGSALIEMGQTKVVCTASVEERVPHWLYQEQLHSSRKRGWVTAEYSILPGAGPTRTNREATLGRKTGRTLEIQRLIGRALRSIVDLSLLGQRTVWIDCDVLQADGGTRTAAITGGYVALALALRELKKSGQVAAIPLASPVAAVSVGLWEGRYLLDLDYEEDSRVDVDLNVVMNEAGELIEVQGTAEHDPFTPEDLARMVALAGDGIGRLLEIQRSVLE